MGKIITYGSSFGSATLTWSGVFGANYYEDWNSELGISETGGLVDSWTSQGLNGGVFAASGGNRPTVSTSATLGIDTIKTDGVSEYMEVEGSNGDYNFLHNGAGGTVILVYIGFIGANNTMFGNTFGTRGFRVSVRDSGNRIADAVYSSGLNTSNSNSNSMLTEFNSSVGIYDSGNATLLDRFDSIVNGTSVQTNTQSGGVSASNASDNLTIGARARGLSGFIYGEFARAIIIDRKLTAQDKLDVQTLLNQDYGTFPIS